MANLNRDSFLNISKPVPVPVETEMGNVFVKAMTVAQRTQYDLLVNGDESRVRQALIICCVCDENGTPLFSNEDFDAVADLEGSAIEPVVLKALSINFLDRDDSLQKKQKPSKKARPSS